MRLLTSPLEALALARRHPDRQVVFLAVGFETTAPATALLVRQAMAAGVANLSLLAAHVRVPPAMAAILTAEGNQVQGFLAAGHVCAVMGTTELEQLVDRHRVPVVVSGFEPLDLMRGLVACVRQLERGQAQVANAYGRVVRQQGNPAARGLLASVFEAVDRPWRGFGVIPGAAWGCGRPSAAWRPGPASPTFRSGRRALRSRRASASAAPSCRGGLAPWTAPPSGSPAPPSIRWGRRWCPPRGPARPTTVTAAVAEPAPPATPASSWPTAVAAP